VAALAGTDLFIEALEEIGAISAGDPLTTNDAAKGLAVLNRMILSQSVNPGNIFTERIDTWPTVIGKQTYTIGVDPAGLLTPDLALARPIRLTRANLLMVSGSNTVRREIKLLTDAEWRAKAVQNVAGIPIELYNDGSNPLSTYYLYMVPSQIWTIETYSWQQFFALPALTTILQIPPGYYEYWLYALAIRCATPFGKTPSATTLALYAEARANVMRLNSASPVMRCDSDHDTGDQDLYNWLSGGIE